MAQTAHSEWGAEFKVKPMVLLSTPKSCPRSLPSIGTPLYCTFISVFLSCFGCWPFLEEMQMNINGIPVVHEAFIYLSAPVTGSRQLPAAAAAQVDLTFYFPNIFLKVASRPYQSGI